jgi:hypothetical protein
MKTGSKRMIGMRIDPMTEAKIDSIGIVGDIELLAKMHLVNIVLDNDKGKRRRGMPFTFHDPKNGSSKTINRIGVGNATHHLNMTESIIQ